MNHQGITVNRPETELSTGSEREPILVVEADAALARGLAEQLTADGHPVQIARTASDAARFAAACPPRLVVLGELSTPRGALDLLHDIRARGPEDRYDQTASPWQPSLPVILLSSRTGPLDLLRAFEAGTDDFLPRTVGYLELRGFISSGGPASISSKPAASGLLVIGRVVEGSFTDQKAPENLREGLAHNEQIPTAAGASAGRSFLMLRREPPELGG
jgi:CheY-like chemotaxis protein